MKVIDIVPKRKYPWVAKQDWTNVLFLHWPVRSEVIKPLVPNPFIIDTYLNMAWISIVIFQAENSRPRFLTEHITPRLPMTQINVRTYVRSNDAMEERGVYFFKLHIKSFLAICSLNTLFSLPFHFLKTKMYETNNGIYVSGRRDDRHVFSVRYEPKAEKIQNELAHFLTERYCIWNIKDNKIIKIPIAHSSWNLHGASIDISYNSLLPVDEKFLLSAPIAQFSAYKRTKIYPYEVYGYMSK